MAIATGNDLISRYDVDVIGELATDSRVTPSRASVATLPHVLTALDRASGEVEVALRSGQLYTPAQLANLDANSTEYLKDIVCCAAMRRLFQRRPGLHDELAERICTECNRYLDQLRKGVDVLGLVGDDSHAKASVAELVGPTPVAITNRNFVASRLSGRHVPHPEDSHNVRFT